MVESASDAASEWIVEAAHRWGELAGGLESAGPLLDAAPTGRFTESVLSALARTDGIGRRLVTQTVPNVWNGCASAPAIRVRGFRFGSRAGKGATP